MKAVRDPRGGIALFSDDLLLPVRERPGFHCSSSGWNGEVIPHSEPGSSESVGLILFQIRDGISSEPKRINRNNAERGKGLLKLHLRFYTYFWIQKVCKSS